MATKVDCEVHPKVKFSIKCHHKLLHIAFQCFAATFHFRRHAVLHSLVPQSIAILLYILGGS